MDPAKYEYQSEFARRYFAEGKIEGEEEGRAKGRAEGKAELVLNLLKLRFGPLANDVVVRVRAASAADLDRLAESVLTAKSIDEVLR